MQRYRAKQVMGGLAASTANLRLSAIRKLAMELAHNGLLDGAMANEVGRVPVPAAARGCCPLEDGIGASQMQDRIDIGREQDAIVSLELVGEQLPRVMTDALHWKWVILALHSALQGFMVLALRGTSALNTLTQESAKRWIEAHEKGEGYPRTKLDWFPSLYAKIQSDRMMMYHGSKPFVPAGTQGRSVDNLNQLRNFFVHFLAHLSLDVSGWPQMVIDTVEIIEFLAFESGNVLWREESLRERTKALTRLVRQQALELEAHYRD